MHCNIFCFNHLSKDIENIILCPEILNCLMGHVLYRVHHNLFHWILLKLCNFAQITALLHITFPKPKADVLFSCSAFPFSCGKHEIVKFKNISVCRLFNSPYFILYSLDFSQFQPSSSTFYLLRWAHNLLHLYCSYILSLKCLLQLKKYSFNFVHTINALSLTTTCKIIRSSSNLYNYCIVDYSNPLSNRMSPVHHSNLLM